MSNGHQSTKVKDVEHQLVKFPLKPELHFQKANYLLEDANTAPSEAARLSMVAQVALFVHLLSQTGSAKHGKDKRIDTECQL